MQIVIALAIITLAWWLLTDTDRPERTGLAALRDKLDFEENQ